MENLLPQVGVIKPVGSMAGPVKEDLPLPMIATRDIGAFAAEALLNWVWQLWNHGPGGVEAALVLFDVEFPVGIEVS